MNALTAARTLHIVYVWDAEYPWDVRAEKTCLALTQAGHDVHIVSRNRNRNPNMERSPEATIHRMAPWASVGAKLDAALSFPAFFNPRWRSLIARTVRTVEADVIIARDVPLCPTAINVGKRFGIPVILDLSEHYPAMIRAIWDAKRQRPFDTIMRNPRAVELVEGYCIRNADHILTVADEMTERLVSLGSDRTRITRVGNTPILSKARIAETPREQRSERIRLVYLGLLEIARGINELIDAVGLLRERHLPVSLLLIGSGRDEQIFRDRVRDRALDSEAVTFAGHLPYASALQLMATADVGVLPLHRNAHMDTTIPNKLFDYMSVGLPVATSDTPPSARIVQTEDAGVVFEGGNALSLVEAIRSLQDPGVRLRMGANGHNAVRARYNWMNDARSLVASVEDVCSENR